MHSTLLVFYSLLSIAYATTTYIHVSECRNLDTPNVTYKLLQDIAIGHQNFGFVCFNITADGVSLDGNGFELYSASNTLLPVTGVKFDGLRTTVTSMRITNLHTGIHANGMFGEVHNNSITFAVNGIDVSATNNRIFDNRISNFIADESTSGIYAYFPPVIPIDSFINITNNVICDITGDSFVVGISVYYAESVHIANNQIINLKGGVSTEGISIIYGSATLHNNTFIQEGYWPSTSTLLISCMTLLLSVYFLRASHTPQQLVAKGHMPRVWKELEKKDEEEEYEMDGADMVPIKQKLSVSLGSSPGMDINLSLVSCMN